MLTQPADLPDDLLCDALRSDWNFAATSLTYRAVGFGSHHWTAADARGTRVFVTVDDLASKLHSAHDTADAAFGRLQRAFTTARSLKQEAALAFVVAPDGTRDGRVLSRLTARYSMVVHPYIEGRPAGRDGEFASAADRRAVLDLLISLHGARVRPPPSDDFTVPLAAELTAALGQTSRPWPTGPFGSVARDLLATHAGDLRLLLAAYANLAERVRASGDRMVITHGEPHAANVLRTPEGLVLVDWDTVLVAPPERDLWVLAEADPSILAAYSAATGVAVDEEALSLYRLWYDLAEIAGYVSLFHGQHGDTADTAEAWRNLRHFLRPAARWPDLVARQAAGPDS